MGKRLLIIDTYLGQVGTTFTALVKVLARSTPQSPTPGLQHARDGAQEEQQVCSLGGFTASFQVWCETGNASLHCFQENWEKSIHMPLI